MKKIDIPLFADTVFFFACSWLLSLCILRYFRIRMWLALILCTVLSLSVGATVFLLLYKSRKKKFLLAQDREEKDKLMLHLALSSLEENKKLFAPVLNKGERTYLLFSMQPLSADTLAEKIRRCPKDQRFTVFCNTLSPEARKLCEDFGITAVEGGEVYAKLKAANGLPQTYICAEKKKRGVKEKLKVSFHKKNSRSFFFSGAALLILSLFSFFPVYYIISGCLLVLTAIVVRIFGYA